MPFLAILIIGTIIILKSKPFRTDEGFVFGTVYKITYQSEDNLKEEIETELKKVDNSSLFQSEFRNHPRKPQ